MIALYDNIFDWMIFSTVRQREKIPISVLKFDLDSNEMKGRKITSIWQQKKQKNKSLIYDIKIQTDFVQFKGKS